MKYFIIASICEFFMLGTALDQHECFERFRKIGVRSFECCKYPNFFEEKDFNETRTKIIDGNLATPYDPIYDCNLTDKTGKIDKESWNKHVKETIKDKNWEPIFQDAYTKCATGGAKLAKEQQQNHDIAIATCDYKFEIVTSCIDIVAFQNCPKDYWTKKDDIKERCKTLKSHSLDCDQDYFAAEDVSDHHKN